MIVIVIAFTGVDRSAVIAIKSAPPTFAGRRSTRGRGRPGRTPAPAPCSDRRSLKTPPNSIKTPPNSIKTPPIGSIGLSGPAAGAPRRRPLARPGEWNRAGAIAAIRVGKSPARRGKERRAGDWSGAPQPLHGLNLAAPAPAPASGIARAQPQRSESRDPSRRARRVWSRRADPSDSRRAGPGFRRPPFLRPSESPPARAATVRVDQPSGPPPRASPPSESPQLGHRRPHPSPRRLGRGPPSAPFPRPAGKLAAVRVGKLPALRGERRAFPPAAFRVNARPSYALYWGQCARTHACTRARAHAHTHARTQT